MQGDVHLTCPRPTTFAIPAGGFPMTSDADHCNYTGNRTNRTYSLTDIDGDALPDLVVTGDCGGDRTIGNTHWDVYKNQGGAFAQTATRFALASAGVRRVVLDKGKQTL